MRTASSACSALAQRRRKFLHQGGAALAATVTGAAFSAFARAQGKPVVLKAVVQHRNGESWKKWLWLQEQVKERSGGQISIEVMSIAELGLGGTEMLRVLKTGVIDMAEVLPGYVASDFPMIEACNLPGISTSFEMSRKLYDTWTANVVGKRENLMGGKIIASFCWNTLFVFTKFELNQLSDFKGRKIRVFAPAQARFITALGGEPVSLTTADVYPSLQRGIIDGCITGADQVKGSSLWEVTRYISNVNIPPMGSYIVLSARSQRKLPEQHQTIFTDLSAQLTDLGWHLGQENDRLGLEFAREKGMQVVREPKPEWVQPLTRISSQDIIPWWANRAGPQAKTAFNDFLSPIVGFKI